MAAFMFSKIILVTKNNGSFKLNNNNNNEKRKKRENNTTLSSSPSKLVRLTSQKSSMEKTVDLNEDIVIHTTEMHTGGEPLRIIESGFPQPEGSTVLEKRNYVRTHLDRYRKFVMFEPRGHFDMYGALLVTPDIPDADIGVVFMHNEGYSTMCGHAIIALGRYAVDKKLVKSLTCPETEVRIQCPCGLVRAFVKFDGKKSGLVRFHSVPAFVLKTDVEVEVEGYGKVKLDISYGGAFYALVPAENLGLNLETATVRAVVDAADAVTSAVRDRVPVSHPDSSDLAFLYGTIVTDGRDEFSEEATANICVFADRQVDRAPTGSGVTARVALQYHKHLISLHQVRKFRSATTDDVFTGTAVKEITYGGYKSVIVEVVGKAFYTGTSTFTWEPDDELGRGFLVS